MISYWKNLAEKSKRIISGIFTRYYLSAIAMVLLPVCIIIFYFNPRLINEAESSAMRAAIDRVTIDKYNMDTHILSLYSIPKQIFQTKALRPHNITESVYNKITASKELAWILANEPLIENIFYYLPNEGVLFNHFGMYSLNDYSSNMFPYRFIKRDKESFSELFKGSSEMRYLSYEPVSYYNAESKPMLSFLAGVAPGSKTPYGYLAIMIYEENLAKFFSSTQDGQAVTCVLDFDQQIIIGGDALAESYLLFLSELSFPENDNVMIYQFEGKSYILASVHSGLNDWIYVNIMPLDAAVGKISQLERLSIFILIAIVLIEALLAWFIAHRNYKPIKNLFNLLAPQKANVLIVGNELTVIHGGIQALINTNTQIAQTVQGYSHAIREQLLRNVIDHKIFTVEEFNRLGLDAGLYFSHELFSVAIIFVPQKRGDAKNNIAMREMLNDIHTPDMDGYFLHNYLNFMSLFIASFSSDEIFYDSLQDVLGSYQTDMALTTFTGIGESVNVITDIDVSFMQACATLEYMEINRQNSMMKYSNLIELFNHTHSYPANHINALQIALIKENLAAINRELDYLNMIISSHKTPFYLIRSIYISVIQILMTYMIKNNDNEQSRKYLYKIDSYLSVDLYDAEILVKNIRNCQTEIIREISLSIQNDYENSNTFSKILTYIDEHYYEQDFSAQKLCEKTGRTLSGFSQYFLKQTGQTFKKYLTTLRMYKACEMLSQTDETIESIAEKTGYLSSVSFIRAFKKRFSKTPGEYRKLSNKGIIEREYLS